MPSNGHLPRGTTAQILAADDIREEEIDVPEWGCSVLIRTFTRRQVSDMTKRATHRDRYTQKDVIHNAELEALTFVEGVADPKFTFEDYEQLQDKSISAMIRIVKAINNLSGLSEEAVQDAVKSDPERSDGEIRAFPVSRAKANKGAST